MTIHEYENIIVSGGLAGISAAIELLDNNKKVLILERDTEENFGGLAKKSFGGILFSGTPLQKRAELRILPHYFLKTGLELLTAKRNNLGIVIFVFHDGELSQISQGQEIPYSRKTSTVLGDFNIDGIAHTVGAEYLVIENDAQIDQIISTALKAAKSNKTVLVDIHIDYKKRTRFTKGIVKAVLGSFPLKDKFRFIGRAVTRKIVG